MIKFQAKQLVSMLALQRTLNERVNPLYHAANYPWHRAAWVECGELLDHLGWKWWKDQQPNLVQAQIEVVDIWHFSLSFVLQQIGHDESVLLAAEKIQTDCALSAAPLDQGWTAIGAAMGESQALLTLVELLAEQCLADNVVSPSITLQLAEKVGLTAESMYRMYLAKNVLNIFRQDHGYKEGTYRKFWRGLEDNEVLAAWMVAEPDWGPDELLAELERSYAQ